MRLPDYAVSKFLRGKTLFKIVPGTSITLPVTPNTTWRFNAEPVESVAPDANIEDDWSLELCHIDSNNTAYYYVKD